MNALLWYIPIPVWLGHYSWLRYQEAQLDAEKTYTAGLLRIITRLEKRIEDLEGSPHD